MAPDRDIRRPAQLDRPADAAASFREVRDGLSDAVIAAGPPPVPVLGPPWQLRQADPDSGDPALIAEWMSLPHVDRFWDQAWPAGRWAAALRGQLAGECTRPCVASYEGIPLAYLELYRTARDVVGRHYPAHAHDLGVHIAIGPPDDIGRGHGRALVRAVVAGLFAADRRCARVLADPDATHAVARRMFTAAGFSLMQESDLGHKRAALLVADRHPVLRST
ncbi:GNAT family N-acetyltransferase [Dactylosporangium sp. NPDC005555]|uniref:GNAT family N-acetyltransferase n=1 Tax=Dactylosporangium sp. NPDC005555 TaxID=3154889 RepID=UPI0033A6BCC4